MGSRLSRWQSAGHFANGLGEVSQRMAIWDICLPEHPEEEGNKVLGHLYGMSGPQAPFISTEDAIPSSMVSDCFMAVI